MQMTTYIYTGALSGVTLDNGQTVTLFPNQKVELPEANKYVTSLIAQGYLKAVKEKYTSPKAPITDNKTTKDNQQKG